jgi:uncharacterized protein with beta-barrel porin domain
VAALLVGLLLSASSALADCILSGQTVTCTGPDTVGGFDAGALNNLTVNVQPLAIVNDNGVAAAAIVLNDTNSVTNNGTVTTLNPNVNGINFGNFNFVTNNGTIAVLDAGIGLAGFDNNVVVNNGMITAGAGGFGVFAGLNSTITNAATGVIMAGDNSSGILVAGNSTVVNLGAIKIGDSGGPAAGIFAINGFNTLINAAGATIKGGDGAAGLAVWGDDATITNAGSITVRDSAPGILVLGDRAVIINTGSIDARDDSAGISVSGDSHTIINRGTITVRDAVFSFATGIDITSLSGGNSIINTGTINVGTNATGISSDTLAGSNSISNSGTINVGSNGTGIFVSGDGAVFNSGKINAATGVAAIEFCGCGPNSSLTLGPGSAIQGLVIGTGAETFQLGGSGKDTFDLSSIGLQYTGFSTFNKVDSSNWTVIGSGAQDWNVLGGTLTVNGTITGIVTVDNGATLAGTGTVGATFLINGATLAPGLSNALGTLTVNDLLQFCNCTFYNVKVTSGGSDLTQVVSTGGPALAGLEGTVRVASLDNTYKFNAPYKILTAAGGFDFGGGATRFDSLVTPTGINGVLSYTTTDVNLTLTSALGQLSGLNINQRNVANALDGAFNAGGISGALGAIFNGNIPLNLTQASGELGTGSQQATFDAMNLFLSLLTDPFVAGRGGFGGTSGATPYADESGAKGYAANRQGTAHDAFAKFATKADVARNDLLNPRWSVWGSAYGGGSNTQGNATLGSQSATARAFGFAAGADYRISPDTLVGFALAGGGTNFSVSGFGTGRSDLFQAGAFVRRNFGAAYVTAAAAYGWQDVTTDRTVTVAGVDRLRAEFNANAWSGRVEAGYRYATPWMGITPYAAGQFTTYSLPAYAEQVLSGAGTFALNYAAKDVTASRTELGVRADKSFAMQNGILTLRGRAAWAHDFNTDRNVTALFQTLPGASFVVNGAAQAHDSALVTAAAEMKWLNGWSAAAVFEGQFSNVTNAYAGKGIARYSW